MSRFLTLVKFLIANYRRNTHLIVEWVLTAISLGVVFDPRWAPYTGENIILGKSLLLIILGVVISFRLIKNQYNRHISVLLNRVTRSSYYLASIVSSFIIVIFFGVVIDLYMLLALGANPTTLFNIHFVLISSFNILVTVSVVHLFSSYIFRDRSLKILGPIILGLGSIPDWYRVLPGKSIFKIISYAFPPLGHNLKMIMELDLGYGRLIYLIIYMGVLITIGTKLFENRSFNDLDY